MSRTIERNIDSQPRLHGAGLVVVHAESGNIKTQIDSTRELTNRKGGQVSVAFETRKPGETHRENVLGALPEVLDDTTLTIVKKNYLPQTICAQPKVFHLIMTAGRYPMQWL